MNCDCGSGNFTVLRTVSKHGPNQGREFHACPSGNCKYFQWADQQGPSHSHRSFQPPPPPSNNNNYINNNSNNNNNNNYKGSNNNFSSNNNSNSHGLNRAPLAKVSTTATIEIKSFDFSQRPVKVWMKMFFPYCQPLTNLLQSFPRECSYDYLSRLWIFDFANYEKVVSSILTLQLESFRLNEIPRFLLCGLSKYLLNINKIPLAQEDSLEITEELLNILLPFQLDGIKYVVARGGRALIGDEMGCGKTVQAIGLLQHYRNNWPALLLMPVNLVEQWKGELLQYSGEILTESDICIIRKKADKVTGKIVIVPYSIIDGMLESHKISPEQFGMVIADESHNIKSLDAKRTQSVLPFLKKIPIAICLTGTPAVNRPVELYTQLSGLVPTVFFSYDQYVERYCDAKPQRFNPNIMDVKGSSNESELKTLMEGLVMIRRLKADVIANLPTKMREVRYVDADTAYATEINRIQKRQALLEAKMKDFTLNNEERGKHERESKQQLLRLYQVTGISKIKAIKLELFQRINDAKLQQALEDSESDANTIAHQCGKEDPILMELESDIVLEGDNKCGNDSEDALIDTDDEDVQSHRKRPRKEKCDELVDLCESSGSDSPVLKKNSKRKIVRENVEDSDTKGLVVHGRSVGKKILVFAHHHEVLDGIEECLREAGVGYIRVDGTTSKPKKHALIKQFQTCNDVDVAVLSITACGTGLNLTTANIAIFAELYWSPGVVLQAEDRIHRIGQTSKEVKLIYLLARNTADDVVWEQIQRKYSVLGATIGTADGMNNFSNATITSSKSIKDNFQQRRIDEFVPAPGPNPPTSISIESKPYSRAATVGPKSLAATKEVVINPPANDYSHATFETTFDYSFPSESEGQCQYPGVEFVGTALLEVNNNAPTYQTAISATYQQNVIQPPQMAQNQNQLQPIQAQQSYQYISKFPHHNQAIHHAPPTESQQLVNQTVPTPSGPSCGTLINHKVFSNYYQSETEPEAQFRNDPKSSQSSSSISSQDCPPVITSTVHAAPFKVGWMPNVRPFVSESSKVINSIQYNRSTVTAEYGTAHQLREFGNNFNLPTEPTVNCSIGTTMRPITECSQPQVVAKELPTLTPELMAKIERNRQEALRKRALIMQQNQLNSPILKTAGGTAVTVSSQALQNAQRLFT